MKKIAYMIVSTSLVLFALAAEARPNSEVRAEISSIIDNQVGPIVSNVQDGNQTLAEIFNNLQRLSDAEVISLLDGAKSSYANAKNQAAMMSDVTPEAEPLRKMTVKMTDSCYRYGSAAKLFLFSGSDSDKNKTLAAQKSCMNDMNTMNKEFTRLRETYYK